jgi:P pilus assembly chaperone PapD
MKPLLALLLTATLAIPALAGVNIEKIHVTPAGNDAGQPRVAVELRNTGTEEVRLEKVVLELAGPQNSWKPVQAWIKPRLISPGQQITVHVAPALDSELGRAILANDYHLQARATLTPIAVGSDDE